jgi:D-galacturonate reductase
MAASAAAPGPVSVLMVGTGEYTTGFGASSAKTDKAAGVVALAMLDLRRRGLVGALSMAGTSSGKFPAMRAHMRRAIDEAFPGSGFDSASIATFPAVTPDDARQLTACLDHVVDAIAG